MLIVEQNANLALDIADRAYVTPADLVDETWLGVPPGFPFERILHAIEQEGGKRVHVSQRFSDMRIMEAFIVAGLGIAFVPRFTSGPVAPGMVLKPIRGVASARQIVALVRPDVAERLAVRTENERNDLLRKVEATARERDEYKAVAHGTIARPYLVTLSLRLKKAAQLLKRGRNASFADDCTDSARLVDKFLRDTRTP